MTVLHGSGGAGATTIAVQMACELVGRAKRKEKAVCLLDFDLQYGNAGLSLDLHGSAGLLHILEAPSRLDAAFFEGAMVRHKTGIDVLTAPNSILPVEALSSDGVAQIFSLARQEYGVAVVDMPTVWSSWTGQALMLSDLVVMVTELTVPALHRTRMQLELMAQQDLLDVPVVVVANRCEKNWEAKALVKQAQAALGRRIDFFVREDIPTLSEARDRGIPIAEVSKRAKIIKDVAEIINESFDRLRSETTSDQRERVLRVG